jgi:hypothetical protein
MKKVTVFTLFLLLCLLIGSESKAQLSIRINIGSQPLWGPVGYDRVDNYYLPDIETYYNVSSRRYTYWRGGLWVSSYSLPPGHENFNLYDAHKVVLNEPRPYLHNDIYRVRYSQYRNRHDQAYIRDSKEEKYFENKNHPMHNEWKGNGHDNGRGNGRDNKERGDDSRDKKDHTDRKDENRGNDKGERGHKKD